LRDDLISAVRYACMMRRSGRLSSECESCGVAPGVDTRPYNPQSRPMRQPQMARRIEFDVFTGE